VNGEVPSSFVNRAQLLELDSARVWLINVGSRSDEERRAHLLCEMIMRLAAVGLAIGYSCTIPLTQSDLGDALALSSVHVNRTLMSLRRQQLVSFEHHKLTIHDYARLRTLAGFDPWYLHLDDVRDKIPAGL
jgi:CRP-like cAMP-binding protein